MAGTIALDPKTHPPAPPLPRLRATIRPRPRGGARLLVRRDIVAPPELQRLCADSFNTLLFKKVNMTLNHTGHNIAKGMGVGDLVSFC